MAHSRHRFMVSVAVAVALSGGIRISASAQVVRGHLVDAADDSGIAGAMMSLVDRNGAWLARVLSGDGGLFELSTPRPGNYRLRADRIGYETSFSDFFDLASGDTLSLRMVTAVAAVSLEGILAEGDRRCRLRPEEGLAVTRVWDEARKALSAAQWTLERGYYRYEMMGIKRRLDRDGRHVVSEDRSYQGGYHRAPFVSIPAEDLAEKGFAQLSPSESVYWAPDADVLLSDHFLDTHCFRLGAADEDRPGMIGLEFEPVPGRNLPEIAGTLWVHPETAHLERLDYRYRNLNLPDALVGADPGGTVQFQGLPNGTWIVDSWRIRMPVAATGMTQLQGRIVTTLEGIVIMGGDVLRVHGTDGTVSEANLRGRIAGKVFDSLGVALPGARVFVEGTGIEIATRRDGGFELADFDPGVYSVNFAYPYMERYSYRPEPFKVEITEGHDTPVQINFAAPRISRILDNLCRDVEQPGQGAILPGGDELLHQGILVGQVFDPDGDPLPGARVRIVAIEYELSSAASQHVRTTRLGSAWAGVTFTTNARGYYLACWIPVDTYLQVAVLEPDQEPDPNTLQVAYTVSELIASREERVIIQAGAPYRTLDLRVEPK
ncbi:MAG: hypothetical protein F4Y07_09995 [Gemmatimonadetes bacterium]|nr:hypothetical protein [Gemmatimonadota bacterium]MYE16795.1 hypothetical protein [Gemmatimonadota bacterium]MYG24250.1 hypothetical protein [Gemmatimonadota bacterium]MYJ39711.1 hypothetical protein [Gemmatimonadota bacterium]